MRERVIEVRVCEGVRDYECVCVQCVNGVRVRGIIHEIIASKQTNKINIQKRKV